MEKLVSDNLASSYCCCACVKVRFQLEQSREGLQRQLAATDGQMHVLQARLEDSQAEQQVHLKHAHSITNNNYNAFQYRLDACDDSLCLQDRFVLSVIRLSPALLGTYPHDPHGLNIVVSNEHAGSQSSSIYS